MGFAQAHQTIVSSIGLLTPTPPRWVGRSMLAAGVLAAVADFVLERQNRRTPPGHADLYRALAEYYRRAAEAESRRRAAGTSRYLQEEGATAETDCFACASAHLAAIEGALGRAYEIARRDGSCTADCTGWLQVAAEEAAALRARDWTADRLQRLPADTREKVARLAERVDGLLQDLLPDEDPRLVLSASAQIAESVRFARAGDSLTHPEVDGRLADAERYLAAAERRDPTRWNPQLGEELRQLRRAVGAPSGADAITAAAHRARDLSARLNAGRWSQLVPDELDRLRSRAERLRAEYRAARRVEA